VNIRSAIYLLAIGAAISPADTITLRDGTRHTGVLVSANRNRVIFNTDAEGRRNFTVSTVRTIEFGANNSGSADRGRGERGGAFPDMRDDSRGRQPGYDVRGSQAAYDNDIARRATELGRNFVGAPVSPEIVVEDGRGRVRVYDQATIYWSPETGAHEVHGSIRDEFLKAGGVTGRLGYPTSDEQAASDGRTRVVNFERGTITWSPAVGARVQYR